MTVSTVSSTTSSGSSSLSTTSAQESSDRFLKLLVAQMQNQDPLSPMDNAEVTSQMAQINTVSGIQTLNTSVQTLSGQFMQMQALQGASLVGHDVVVQGNKLAITDGVAQGGFELAGAADNVKVEVLSPAGVVIDTIQSGAQGSGMHSFTWPTGTADVSAGLTFRVTATSGSAKVSATPLMVDQVSAVNTNGDTLMLELAKSGPVPFTDVKSYD